MRRIAVAASILPVTGLVVGIAAERGPADAAFFLFAVVVSATAAFMVT